MPHAAPAPDVQDCLRAFHRSERARFLHRVTGLRGRLALTVLLTAMSVFVVWGIAVFCYVYR